jgi:Trypsin-co-occurring domain 1
MDSCDTDTRVITAVLPSGMPIKVEIAQPSDDEDEMASVGLRDLEVGKALDSLGEIASLVVEKLKAAKPTKATVQLGLAFSVEAGKLTALWVGGQGNASLNVTMEWSAPPAQPIKSA